MMKRFQAFSEPNDEMFKYHWLLGKITSIPPQRGRSLVFLKRRTAYPFFLSLAGYVFPRSAERRRKTVLYHLSIVVSLRQAPLHNEAVQNFLTALYVVHDSGGL